MFTALEEKASKKRQNQTSWQHRTNLAYRPLRWCKTKEMDSVAGGRVESNSQLNLFTRTGPASTAAYQPVERARRRSGPGSHHTRGAGPRSLNAPSPNSEPTRSPAPSGRADGR